MNAEGIVSALLSEARITPKELVKEIPGILAHYTYTPAFGGGRWSVERQEGGDSHYIGEIWHNYITDEWSAMEVAPCGRQPTHWYPPLSRSRVMPSRQQAANDLWELYSEQLHSKNRVIETAKGEEAGITPDKFVKSFGIARLFRRYRFTDRQGAIEQGIFAPPDENVYVDIRSDKHPGEYVYIGQLSKVGAFWRPILVLDKNGFSRSAHSFKGYRSREEAATDLEAMYLKMNK
jgi:hypothetical protein